MATTVDYENGINANDIGTIYLTGAGYVNYPFRGASRESALGWEEPVWGAELNRSIDLVMDNIDDIEYGLVARCEISYKYLNVQDYRVLCKIAKQKVCIANFFNRETGERVTQEMAFTGNEISKLYKFGSEYLGVLDMSIKLVATNRDRQDIIGATHTVSYYPNGGSGSIDTDSVSWANQLKLSDGTGFTNSGKSLLYWTTNSNGTGEKYLPGQSITVFKTMKLFAQWSIGYTYDLTFAGLDANGDSASGANITNYMVTGVVDGNNPPEEIIIPSTYNSLPVTTIDESAFAGLEIKKITIPSSVTKIGDNAFRETLISEFKLSSSVTTLGTNICEECPNLEKVEIEQGVTSISDYAFTNCPKISTIIIPDSVTSIGFAAFAGTGVKDVVFAGNASVQTLEVGCFEGCRKLKQVSLPSSVYYIKAEAFANCSALEKIFIYSTSWDKVNSSGNSPFLNVHSSAKIYIPTDIVGAPSNSYGSYWSWNGTTSLQYFKVL